MLFALPVGGVNIWPIGRGMPWENHGCFPVVTPWHKLQIGLYIWSVGVSLPLRETMHVVSALVDSLEILAGPIASIYNRIVQDGRWPSPWLTEHVTIIPKNNNPETLSECRNISCTNYLSKLFERIVLSWAKEQVQPKSNQYGGQKGCSTDHFLVDVWDQITDHLEDQRAAVILTSIDYSKAST